MMISTTGPIELVWARVQRGELLEDTARALVAAPDVTRQLTFDYVASLTNAAESITYEHPIPGVQLGRLLRAAADAATGPDADRIRRYVAMGWLEVATRSVSKIPDGRVLRDATAAGESLVADALKRDDRREAGLALHRLGVLHLDPYTAGRNQLNYDFEMRQWRARMIEVFGTTLARTEQTEWIVPEPLDALATAENYLRKALDYRAGRDRALTLKALAQTLEWRASLGGAADVAGVVAACNEALALLDPRKDPRDCAALLATLDRANAAIPKAVLDGLLETPLSDLAERRTLSPLQVLDLSGQLIAVLRRRNPERALDLIRETEPLRASHASDQMRSWFWIQELELMVTTRAPGFSMDLTRGLEAAADDLRRAARRAGWSNETIAAALLLVASEAPKRDEEPIGLALVKEALERAPQLATEHANVVSVLTASLCLGVAVNFFNAKDMAKAAEWYSAALARYLNVNFTRNCIDCVQRIGDVGARGDEDAATYAIAALAEHAIELEQRIGDPASEAIQAVCRMLVVSIVKRGGGNAELVNVILNVAKGLRFAAGLLRSRPYDARDDADAMARLQAIGETRGTLPEMDPADEPGAMPAASLVVAYVGTTERLPGVNVNEVIENIQIGFDDYVSRRILADVETAAGLHPSIDQIRAALDERTVVVTYYFTPTPDGNVGVMMLAFSRDDLAAAMGAGDFPSATVEMTAGGRTVALSFLAVGVQSILEKIQARPPAGSPVDAEAGALLGTERHQYLDAGLGQFLAEQRRRGRDHLCIVPHGPLHYLPFHLLGAPGQPLADEWLVTTLPNLRLLTRRPQPSRARTLTGVAVGVSAVGEAREEANAVAQVFGTPAIVDADATRAATIEALETARRVHVATHGALHFSAPSFQYLELAPDAASNGRFHAYEALALDLRGLDLVTLSACETALGRFDRSDNLRGFPASFLLAGADTVVGTLWRVETNAARRFFVRLHQLLGEGKSRLDAFGGAQRGTRAEFPDYRDWGAFYLMGQWS
jgi:hypothetical protein